MDSGESESKLIGDLAKKAKPPSELRGGLVKPRISEKTQRIQPPLKGSLVIGSEGKQGESTEIELGPGTVLVQRDSGDIYTIAGLVNRKNGGTTVRLEGADKRKITVDLDSLKKVLGSDEGAWSEVPKDRIKPI